MGKVLATIGALLIVWVLYPHLIRGEFVAPTGLPPGTWLAAQAPEYYSYPEQGYGWFRFDFWNNPPVTGRPVYKSDFRL